MNRNVRVVFPLLLMGFWLFLAFRAFVHGDWTLAMVFLGTGMILTAWRLNSAKTEEPPRKDGSPTAAS